MGKRSTVLIALLATCLLGTAAFGRSPARARVGIDIEGPRAKAEARLRKAIAKGNRAARSAGVRVTVRGEEQRARSRAAERRDAIRRNILKDMGGDRRPGRR
jgi:hypothetical protein